MSWAWRPQLKELGSSTTHEKPFYFVLGLINHILDLYDV